MKNWRRVNWKMMGEKWRKRRWVKAFPPLQEVVMGVMKEEEKQERELGRGLGEVRNATEAAKRMRRDHTVAKGSERKKKSGKERKEGPRRNVDPNTK